MKTNIRINIKICSEFIMDVLHCTFFKYLPRHTNINNIYNISTFPLDNIIFYFVFPVVDILF